MKTIHPTVVALAGLLAAPCLDAADFDSGSNGSFGALNVTSNTVLNLPADGILHCTTINIAPGVVLEFNRNALNTPVYLLATGDVVINGHILLNGASPASNILGGRAGPGGFDGGPSGFFSSSATQPAGAGLGPGGGGRGDTSTAGSGGFGTVSTYQSASRNHGTMYGNALLLPLIGGSGGGGMDATNGGYGGGGGGAVLIASSTKITVVSGASIQVRGGPGGAVGGHGGSGGAVRLVAPKVYGSGAIYADGPYQAGDGRIRVDSLFKIDPLDNTQFLGLTFVPGTAATVGANMIVFPPDNPRLDVIQAAGTSIAEGTGNAVAIVLPLDSPAAQTVQVQARNFGAVVPIRVALIPETGDATFFDGSIDNAAANPATTTVNVTMPANVKVEIQVWSR